MTNMKKIKEIYCLIDYEPYEKDSIIMSVESKEEAEKLRDLFNRYIDKKPYNYESDLYVSDVKKWSDIHPLKEIYPGYVTVNEVKVITVPVFKI